MKLTEKQKLVVDFTKKLARRIMGIDIEVEVYNIRNKFPAWYGDRVLSFNLKLLATDFFENFPNNLTEILALIIHEFGHEYSGDHLSREYHKALCELGAKMVLLARDDSELFTVKATIL